jgi:hypothetical protein
MSDLLRADEMADTIASDVDRDRAGGFVVVSGRA